MSNVKSMVDVAKSIWTATQDQVNGMNDGDRVRLEALVLDVSTVVSMDPKDVVSFVHYFVHNSDTAYVTRGKNGGVVKGVKSAKVVKPAKAPKQATNEASSDTDSE